MSLCTPMCLNLCPSAPLHTHSMLFYPSVPLYPATLLLYLSTLLLYPSTLLLSPISLLCVPPYPLHLFIPHALIHTLFIPQFPLNVLHAPYNLVCSLFAPSLPIHAPLYLLCASLCAHMHHLHPSMPPSISS